MRTIFFSVIFTGLFSISLYTQPGWFSVYGDTNAAWQWNYFTDVNTGYTVGYKIISGLGYPRIVKTTNSGLNWTEQITPERDSVNFYFRCICFPNVNTGFITVGQGSSTTIGRILRTTNGGNNWNIIPLPVEKQITNIFFINSVTGFVSGYQTILKTTDSGTNWIVQNSGFPYYLFAIHFTDVNTGYITGNLGTILKTTNSGNNWEILNTGTSVHLWGIHFADANTGIAVGGTSNNTQNLILRTTNAGNNWDVIPYSYSSCLLWSVRFINPTTGFIIGWCSQVIKTTNGGLTWSNQILPENSYWGRSCYFINTTTGYLAGEYDLAGDLGRIYKTTDGGGSFVNINPGINNILEEFHLHQNYPNPFNPATKIKFEIPLGENSSGSGSSKVKLIIYNSIGQEVAVLVNEQLKPGTYEVEWDAARFSSGIYFYALFTNKYTVTRKMIYLK